VKLELGSELKYDPFVGFEFLPSKQLFNQSSIARLQCRFDQDLPSHPSLANTTLLSVNLILQSGL
jgi:hypothetical protein